MAAYTVRTMWSQDNGWFSASSGWSHDYFRQSNNEEGELSLHQKLNGIILMQENFDAKITAVTIKVERIMETSMASQSSMVPGSSSIISAPAPESPRRQRRETRPRSSSVPPDHILCWHGSRNVDDRDPGSDGGEKYEDSSLIAPWRSHLDSILFFNNTDRSTRFFQQIEHRMRRKELRVFVHRHGSQSTRYFKLQCTVCSHCAVMNYGKWESAEDTEKYMRQVLNFLNIPEHAPRGV